MDAGSTILNALEAVLFCRGSVVPAACLLTDLVRCSRLPERPPPSSPQIAAGQNSAVMQIKLKTDGLVEGPEFFTINLLDSCCGGFTVGAPGSVTIGIQDADFVSKGGKGGGAPQLAVASR